MKPDPSDQRCDNCHSQKCVVFIGNGKCKCNHCGYVFDRTYAKKPQVTPAASTA